jgi:hypothetical protein
MPSRAELLYRSILDLTPAEQTATVEGWASAAQSESEFLEFKRRGDERTDKEKWSQALSGFANTEGGVLVWGIGTKRVPPPDGGGRRIDVADELKPFTDTVSFTQLLRDTHRESTVYPVRGVEYHTVQASQGGGYVLCHVPQGDSKPYRDARTNQYWQRMGDSFEVIPHSLLQSLFFPRSSARISVSLRFQGSVVFVELLNRGEGSAQDLAVTVKVPSRFWKIGVLGTWRKSYEVYGDVLGENWVSFGVESGGLLHPQQHTQCVQILPEDRDGQRDLAPFSVMLSQRDKQPDVYRLTKDEIDWQEMQGSRRQFIQLDPD